MNIIVCLMPCRCRHLIALIVMAMVAYVLVHFRANYRGELEGRGWDRQREIRRRWRVPCR